MAANEAEKSDAPRGGGSPLAIVLPPNRTILEKVRELVADLEKRQDAAAKFADDDPVIVLEVLKAANVMALSEGKPPITTTRGAFVRLGAQAGVERVDRIGEIPDLSDQKLAKCLEAARLRCRRTGRVATILAQLLAKTLVEDCQTAGVLYPIGDMIGVMHLQGEWIKVTEGTPRTKYLYRLEKDHKFDPLKTSVAYLRRAGIPDAVLYAIDPAASTKTPNRTIMKAICAAAEEFVSIYEADRWAKLAPENPLPPRSSIRLLNLSESQYEGLYEQVGFFLFSSGPPPITAAKS